MDDTATTPGWLSVPDFIARRQGTRLSMHLPW